MDIINNNIEEGEEFIPTEKAKLMRMCTIKDSIERQE